MSVTRRIVVFGANGRVGSKVCEIAKAQKMQVVAVDKTQPKHGFFDGFVPAKDVLDSQLEHVCGVVDFSLPNATEIVCNFCKKHGCPLVTGVTGLNGEQQKMLENLKNTVPVVSKSNFALGIEGMQHATKMLCELFPDWQVKLVEIHRKDKLDAPSGTAKMLAKTVESCGKNCPVESIRQGQVFGTHVITFSNEGQSVSVCHNAENVDIFAQGALNSLAVLLKEQ